MYNQPETSSAKEIHKKVQKLATEIEQIICQIYSVDQTNLTMVADYIWDDSEERLKQLTGLKALNYPGTTCTIVIDEMRKARVIFLFQDIKQALAHATRNSLIRGNDSTHLATLVEETSHFIYQQVYEGKHGEDPNSALTELIAVLDRYNIAQYLSIEYTDRNLSQTEHASALEENAVRNESVKGLREGKYIIGHELGEQYIGYLNQLVNGGTDPSEELHEFYSLSNREQLLYLLGTREFKIRTYKFKEEKEVRSIFQQLEIPEQYWNIEQITVG
ncbi:MAG: hypothetical protein U9O78_02410 [Patescibacteria group bacterium]|nr:hypothetical protein [Patescibacteria group bacterium]